MKNAYHTLRPVGRQRFLGVAYVILCVAIPAECVAQNDNFHSCTFNAAGGPAFNIGSEKSSYNSGWNFQAGGGFSVSGRPDHRRQWSVFLDANFMYAQMGITQDALNQAMNLNPLNIGIQQATSDSHAKYYATTLDPTLRLPGKNVQAYLFGGFGWFRRTLQFRGTSSQGSLLQPDSPVVFGEGGNSGGWDAGAGVNFVRFHGMRGYGELRFVHGLAINSATTLLVPSFGIRW